MNKKSTFTKYFNDRFKGRVDADNPSKAIESLLEDVGLLKNHLDDEKFMSSNWPRNIRYMKYKDGNEFKVVLN